MSDTWIKEPAVQGAHGPIIKNSDGRMVAVVSGGFPDTESNADIIAAAHDTLKILERINNWWMTTPGFQDGEDDMPAELFDGMQDAIAKARRQK